MPREKDKKSGIKNESCAAKLCPLIQQLELQDKNAKIKAKTPQKGSLCPRVKESTCSPPGHGSPTIYIRTDSHKSSRKSPLKTSPKPPPPTHTCGMPACRLETLTRTRTLTSNTYLHIHNITRSPFRTETKIVTKAHIEGGRGRGREGTPSCTVLCIQTGSAAPG